MKLINGDSTKVMATLLANSVDALVCDPPAGIDFMGKDWDGDLGSRNKWINYMTRIYLLTFRVMKPGAHGLVWAIPRTSHWTAMALENAGFEVRDVVTHLFGSGFPKSHDISKAIDKKAGAEREVVGKSGSSADRKSGGIFVGENEGERLLTAPATDDAKKWQGFGTALKPSSEHWVLIRKPIEGTIAENVLKYGVGGLNIDGSRIGTQNSKVKGMSKGGNTYSNQEWDGEYHQETKGRFPANTVLDEEAAKMLDEQSGEKRSSGVYDQKKINSKGMFGNADQPVKTNCFSDKGGASRFFYVAKPSKRERNAGLEGMEKKQVFGDDGGTYQGLSNSKNADQNHHPTVKPIKLMQYLIKLITPPNGLILDPFMGSGTTGVAAKKLGFNFIGIEREKEYFEIAQKRIENLD